MEIDFHQLWLDTPEIVFAERVPTECGVSLDEASHRPGRKPLTTYHGLKPHEAEVLLAL